MEFRLDIAPWLPEALADFEAMRAMGYDITDADIERIILDAMPLETWQCPHRHQPKKD